MAGWCPSPARGAAFLPLRMSEFHRHVEAGPTADADAHCSPTAERAKIDLQHADNHRIEPPRSASNMMTSRSYEHAPLSRCGCPRRVRLDSPLGTPVRPETPRCVT